MTHDELLRAVREICVKLGGPLPQEEYSAGWTEQSRLDMLRFFEKLETDLREGVDIPYVSIGRMLDTFGIDGGVVRGRVSDKRCVK